MPLYSPSGAALTVEEEDANPSVANVSKIQVSNGKLTNDGGGTVSLDLSGSAVASGTLIEVDYVEKTSDTSVTATTEATANTVVTANALAGDGTTKYLIEFNAPYLLSPSGVSIELTLYDGSSSIGILGQSGNGVFVEGPVHVGHRLTPSNASHTYSIRAWVGSGTGTVKGGAGGSGNFMPAYIRIVKITT